MECVTTFLHNGTVSVLGVHSTVDGYSCSTRVPYNKRCCSISAESVTDKTINADNIRKLHQVQFTKEITGRVFPRSKVVDTDVHQPYPHLMSNISTYLYCAVHGHMRPGQMLHCANG